MTRWTMLLVFLGGCRGDDGASPADGSTADPPPDAPQHPDGFDSTGGIEDCGDPIHGNQDPGSATPIELDPDGSAVSLGDLVVCSSTPSDFFVLHAECAGYLSIELRRIERDEPYMPDLVLYDDGQPIEQLMGVWYGFFLKPLQRHVGAGTYVLEVRHSGGSEQRYSLTTRLLPDSTCR